MKRAKVLKLKLTPEEKEAKKWEKLDKRINELEKRLINFGAERERILIFWKNKESAFEKEGLRDEAYIINCICGLIEEADPNVAYKKLTVKIRQCQLPLLRDFYRKAREDISRLRTIQLEHTKLRKLKDKKVTLDTIRRGLLAIGEAEGVLPAQQRN